MMERLEALLIETARARTTITYQHAAERLALTPPGTIQQLTMLLEALMRQHAASGRPQLAGLVVSRARRGIPAPGYFLLMKELGLYAGSDAEADARAFHLGEVQRCYGSVG